MYYAYINSENICVSVWQLPEAASASYIPITEEQYTSQSVVGMRWNAETSTWEEVIEYYYAVVDENDICINLVNPESEVVSDSYIAITKEEYEAQTLIGQWYNRETETWEAEVPFSATAAHSTDEINYRDQNTCLSDLLDSMPLTTEVYTKEQADAKFALIGSTGSGTGSGTPGVDGEDGGYYTPSVAADGTLSWTASKTDMPAVTSVNIKGADGQDGAPGAAGADGQDGTTVVVGTVTTGAAGSSAAVQGVLNEETNTLTLNFTIPQGAQGEPGEKGDAGDAASVDAYTKSEVDTMLSGKADSTHAHAEYATVDALAGKADATHSHADYATVSELNGKADASHSHSEYASSSHTHSNYASSTHTHTGYASSSHTHTPASIGASASGHQHTSMGSCEFTGTLRTRDIVSGNAGNCNIGGYSNRYKFIYSVNQLQVESDERVKHDIGTMPVDQLAAFVNGLRVVTYKHNTYDPEQARIGLIAQEIQTVNPELAAFFVRTEEGGMLGLSAADLVYPLIAAVQALSARVAELEK